MVEQARAAGAQRRRQHSLLDLEHRGRRRRSHGVRHGRRRELSKLRMESSIVIFVVLIVDRLRRRPRERAQPFPRARRERSQPARHRRVQRARRRRRKHVPQRHARRRLGRHRGGLLQARGSGLEEPRRRQHPQLRIVARARPPRSNRAHEARGAAPRRERGRQRAARDGVAVGGLERPAARCSRPSSSPTARRSSGCRNASASAAPRAAVARRVNHSRPDQLIWPRISPPGNATPVVAAANAEWTLA